MSKFYFRRKSRFHWRRNSSIKQSCYSWGGTRWNWYRRYWRLTGFTWACFINEEYGNLKVVVDGGELPRNSDRKRKSEVLQAYISPLFDKCSKRYWSKYEFSWGYIFLWVGGYVVNKLNGREDCCAMKNLGYLLCCKWNILIKPCGTARILF